GAALGSIDAPLTRWLGEIGSPLGQSNTKSRQAAMNYHIGTVTTKLSPAGQKPNRPNHSK
ncbi:MAG TPA: hypothetical protein VF018_10805, partial [Acidobacteriaceae bacterium]